LCTSLVVKMLLYPNELLQYGIHSTTVFFPGNNTGTDSKEIYLPVARLN
jgi:hypothetical protein